MPIKDMTSSLWWGNGPNITTNAVEIHEIFVKKQNQFSINFFKISYFSPFSIFDKDDDGFIPVNEMRNILQSLGDKMTEHELDEMMVAADSDQDGFINYEGLYVHSTIYLCPGHDIFNTNIIIKYFQIL